MNAYRIDCQTTYILHTRAYRETSFLVEAFTREHGRVSLVAKGVRSAKSKWRGLLQPFFPLLISWVGKSELYTMTNVEPYACPRALSAERLLCALYVNELLLRILHREDSHPILFDAYAELLSRLSGLSDIQVSLRLFEKQLLREMGYAFSLTHDCKTQLPIVADQYYDFEPTQGLYQTTALGKEAFTGASILALAEDSLEQAHLRDVKRLLRLALLPLIGDKPLRSRELFI